jgi:hypothetical protein
MNSADRRNFTGLQILELDAMFRLLQLKVGIFQNVFFGILNPPQKQTKKFNFTTMVVELFLFRN